MYSDASDVGIGWVYCIYNETGQTAQNLLASLLQQFYRQTYPLSPEIRKSYKYHDPYSTRPPMVELSRLLKSHLQHFAKVYIVIDALDECPDSDRIRDHFLTELRNLPSNVQLLITSRPNSSIEHMLEAAKCLEISAHEDDVRRHLVARISNEPRLTKHTAADRQLHDTVTSTIIEKARGMYVKGCRHEILYKLMSMSRQVPTC